MRYLVLLGRILFALIFLLSSFNHFSSATIARVAGRGIPMAPFLVPAAGILALVGSASVILGFKARWGAWLLVLFLVPVTLLMHNFWTVTDPMMRQTQYNMFMKNLSMLGGALLLTYFGAGPLSIDARRNEQSRVQ